MKKRWIICGIGLLCMMVSVVSFFVVNAYTSGEKTLSFASAYKDRKVTLNASLWKQDNAEYAVLICPGYSCDRQKWKPFVNLFTAAHMSVMTFDYAGQGASSGTIGFDNAKTDAIPVEIADAIEVLHEETGIPYEKIILAGHSMGGRSILRLLQDYNNPKAETTVSKRPIANVILLSPEVNFHENTQASLFAGTSDGEEEPWKSFEASYVAGTNVYLYGSTADDIVADEDVCAIYAHLGGNNGPEGGVCEVTAVNAAGSKLTLGIDNGVLHSYMMYSPKYAAYVNQAIRDITGQTALYAPWKFRLIYVGWTAALIGIFVFLYGCNLDAGKTGAEKDIPALRNTGDFLKRKLLLWIPGILMAGVLCTICVIIPFGSPVMNIPYMCFIAGYGLVMLFAYRKGTFPGVDGRLPKPVLTVETRRREWVSGIIIAALICGFVQFVLRSSMYRLMPLNFRLFWLLFAGALMAAGYYISGVESDMLNEAHAPAGIRFLYSVIQYIPLFLFVLFYLVIKSYSGLIGQILNVFLMYILCIPIGTFLRRRTGNRLYGAVFTAVLFQLLMITSAALIAMF